MRRLSESQRSWLKEAVLRYRASLPGSPGEEYLATRGLTYESVSPEVDRFLLGYVADPLPGHDQFQGMLAIPYLRWAPGHGWTVVSIRFRCIEDHEHKGHGKYLTQAGDRPRLFNTLALLPPSPSVVITEGEIDAITAQACGVPAVGVPGAQAWRPHFREPFLGYRGVFVLADGDDPGMKFATAVAETLPNAKVVQCPPGEDVNSLVINRGKQELMRRLR